MYVAVKAANPNWKPGQKFDTSILDNIPVSYTHLDVYKRQDLFIRVYQFISQQGFIIIFLTNCIGNNSAWI